MLLNRLAPRLALLRIMVVDELPARTRIADRENERLIREAIEREFPGDGILGEEGSTKEGSSGRRWIIDPIDGTRDYGSRRIDRGTAFGCAPGVETLVRQAFGITPAL